MGLTVYTQKEKLTLGGDRPGVILSLCLPRVREEDRIAKGFTAYYGSLRSGFLGFAKEVLQKKAEGESKPCGAVLSTVVSWDGDGLVSLYVDASVTIGEDRRHHRISQLWRKDVGILVKSAQVFNRGWVRAIKPLLVNAAAEYAEDGATPLFADWERQVRDKFDKERFYLTPKGIVFYYQGGELSPKPKPVPLHLPWDCLSSMVRPSFLPFLPKEE